MKKILYILTIVILVSFAHAEDKQTDSTQILRTFPIAIPDGSALILKEGNNIGIAVLNNQSAQPESFSFNWYFRSDGKFDFREGSKEVERGTQMNISSLKFGSFEVEWSANKTGKGFIYLNNSYYTGVVVGVDESQLNVELLNLEMIRYVTAETVTPKIDQKHLY